MVYTNKVPCGHMRAPGYPQGVFASESQMDVVADELGMDPAEFRRINLMRAGEESPAGKRLPHVEPERVLDRALRDSRYHGPKAPRTGRGVAMSQWMPLGGECHVFVTVDGDGGVTVAAAVMDQGSGVHTVMRQGRGRGARRRTGVRADRNFRYPPRGPPTRGWAEAAAPASTAAPPTRRRWMSGRSFSNAPAR